MAQDRFEAMDGLRGLAALIVLAHHIELTKHATTLLLHGYLAVDLFFVLSGFVIGHAYESRLRGGLSLGGFMRERLIRLYPLAALGALVSYLGTAVVGRPYDVGTALVLQLLFVPMLWRPRGDLFLLNGVQWSLLFELLANLAHGAALRWLTTRRLAAVTAVCAVLLALTAWRFGSLGVGWGVQNFAGGLARVGFGYSAGLLIFRLHRAGRLPRLAAPWWALAVIPLALVLIAGHTGWRGDLFAALCFPPLVAAAVRTRLPARTLWGAAWLGALSYPLYALQGPIKHMLRPTIEAMPSPYEAAGWAGYVAVLLLAAWAALRWFDEPTRRWLRQPLAAKAL